MGLNSNCEQRSEQVRAKISRSESVIESGAKQIFNKLNQLLLLVDQMHHDEVTICDQLEKNNQELRSEAEQIEAKQQKIQDCLRSFQNL